MNGHGRDGVRHETPVTLSKQSMTRPVRMVRATRRQDNESICVVRGSEYTVQRMIRVLRGSEIPNGPSLTRWAGMDSLAGASGLYAAYREVEAPAETDA